MYPHGNSKSKKPYYPTWPSTRELIKKECESHGPKHTIQSVSSKVGGVLNIDAPGKIPRNERQILYYKQASKQETSDDLLHIVQLCKNDTANFIRDVRVAPEPSIILATDRQLADLVKFCTQTPFCIMTIDPTFNLGEFDVKVISYRNLMLETHRYQKHPIFVGPIMIHYRKTFQTYLNFINTLIGLQPELVNIKAFGTDDEEALHNAFKTSLQSSTHLLCCIHLQRNITQKLRQFGCTPSLIDEFLNDIVGSQIGTIYYEGLIDCINEENFDKHLSSLQQKWESRHECGSKFFEWFVKEKAEKLKTSVIAYVRESAGLGSPPSKFNTNASETINFILKSKVDHKKQGIPDFIQKMYDLVINQQEELQRAVCGLGKWCFAPTFQFLQVPSDEWFCMKPEVRRRYVDNRVHGTYLADADITTVSQKSPDVEEVNNSITTTTSKQQLNHLSVSVESFAKSVSVPLLTLSGIWTKAEKLLEDPDNFSIAPG
jgi:hypothetical protein